jgi:hypothetical protein
VLAAGDVAYDAVKQLLTVTGLQGVDLSKGFRIEWAAAGAAAA